jgi:hypothetical protein
MALQKPGALEEVIQAVADAVARDCEHDWLIVSYLITPLRERLAGLLKEGVVDKLHFLHWGDHHGTNEFAHCRNVVLVGQLTYGAPEYPALASACGVTPASRLEEAAGELKDVEYSHNILQALTRASVRASLGGLAGTCNAFVIASPGTKARELIDQTFPGCSIDTWTPTWGEASGKAGQLIAILEEARHCRDPLRLPKKEVRAELGLNAQNFARLLGHHPAVTAFIRRHGINVRPRAIEFRGSALGPYSGPGYENGFQVAELDEPV